MEENYRYIHNIVRKNRSRVMDALSCIKYPLEVSWVKLNLVFNKLLGVVSPFTFYLNKSSLRWFVPFLIGIFWKLPKVGSNLIMIIIIIAFGTVNKTNLPTILRRKDCHTFLVYGLANADELRITHYLWRKGGLHYYSINDHHLCVAVHRLGARKRRIPQPEDDRGCRGRLLLHLPHQPLRTGLRRPWPQGLLLLLHSGATWIHCHHHSIHFTINSIRVINK